MIDHCVAFFFSSLYFMKNTKNNRSFNLFGAYMVRIEPGTQKKVRLHSRRGA